MTDIVRLRSFLPLLPLALLTPFGVGCADDGPATCEELLPECRSFQSTCVEAADGPECVPCADGEWVGLDGSCNALIGEALHHDFAELTVRAGEEVRGQCQSWSLNNPEEIWVSAVEFSQNVRSHHSIWTFAPADAFPGPDGVWTCEDRNYNELVGTLAGGVLFAQSTQTEHEVQRFPAGGAIRIAPYSMVIGDVHLLNAGAEDVTGHAELTLYTVPESAVERPLTPFMLDFHAVQIPARSNTRLVTECDLASVWERADAGPFDMKIHYVLPHTHESGRRFFVQLVGGPNDGTMVIDSRGYREEARGQFFEPSISTLGATGIRFGCEYENPTDRMIQYGWDQEMCQGLGFAESGIAFQAAVLASEQEPSADGMTQFTGECNVLAVRWDHDKPGGPPPGDTEEP